MRRGRMRHEGRYASHELIEAVQAAAYTERWHVTDAWASALVASLPDNGPWPSPYVRIALWRGQWVMELDNEEEAYKHARRPIEVEDLLWGASDAPTRTTGGHRRVAIRAYCWIMDERAETALDPEWITLGQGMSARQAWAKAQRWLKSYQDVIDRGAESRLLGFTAIEVAFWTSTEGTSYV